jgi:type IV pilus assembly protein PilX
LGERERGAALITGLSMLVVLTLLGIAAAFMADLEERMSGNRRDRALAFQAAEAALRDAEKDIRNSGRVSGLTSFTPQCTDGLCYNGSNGYGDTGKPPPAGFSNPVWASPGILADAPSVAYSTYTDAPDLEGKLVDQPRYLIEGFKKIVPGGGEAYYYRITARGVGAQQRLDSEAVSEVILQEVFRPI